MIVRLIAVAACSAALTTSAFAQGGPAQRMLQQIAALEGEWEGNYQWQGGRSGQGELRVVYQVTAMGSAVIETMIQDGRPTMTSVYHLDGESLRMTHYCATTRQSRLRALPHQISDHRAAFDFVDVTNADPSRPGYVTGFSMHIEPDGRLFNQFIFEGGVPRAVETITLRRAPNDAKPAASVGQYEAHHHGDAT